MSIEALRAQHCVPRKGKDAGLSTPTRSRAISRIFPAGRRRATADRSPRRSSSPTISTRWRSSTRSRRSRTARIIIRIWKWHYDRCVVSYSTHDVGGLSLNDFICAAKVGTSRRATSNAQHAIPANAEIQLVDENLGPGLRRDDGDCFVIPAESGNCDWASCVLRAKALGPRLRADDDRAARAHRVLASIRRATAR